MPGGRDTWLHTEGAADAKLVALILVHLVYDLLRRRHGLVEHQARLGHDCAVCLADYDPTVKQDWVCLLPCGHWFCRSCANRLAADGRKRKCPMCSAWAVGFFSVD